MKLGIKNMNGSNTTQIKCIMIPQMVLKNGMKNMKQEKIFIIEININKNNHQFLILIHIHLF